MNYEFRRTKRCGRAPPLLIVIERRGLLVGTGRGGHDRPCFKVKSKSEEVRGVEGRCPYLFICVSLRSFLPSPWGEGGQFACELVGWGGRLKERCNFRLSTSSVSLTLDSSPSRGSQDGWALPLPIVIERRGRRSLRDKATSVADRL